MNRPIALAAILLLSLSFAGCRGCREAQAPAPQSDAQPAAAPASGTPASGTAAAAAPVTPVPLVFPPVVARVNGEEILRADLERSIRGVETEVNQRVPGDKRDGVVRGVLERLINYRLLLQEARARGIEVAPGEIDAQLDALARQFRSEEELRAALMQRGVTVDMLREDARRDLRVAKLVSQEAGKDVAVPVEDVRKFYDANLERFRQPESARASHVFVRVPADADEKARNGLRQRAESIMRLAKRGDDFAALAKNYSEDRATGVKGGELGWFNRGATPREFDEVVFALQPGEIGGPAHTVDGYHIVKVAGRRPSRIQPFEEVQSDLATYLLRELQDRLTVRLINQLREKAKIEVLL
ncbi:MAG: peptidylprolyl isomerase [Vicinamibacterales bacterium]